MCYARVQRCAHHGIKRPGRCRSWAHRKSMDCGQISKPPNTVPSQALSTFCTGQVRARSLSSERVPVASHLLGLFSTITKHLPGAQSLCLAACPGEGCLRGRPRRVPPRRRLLAQACAPTAPKPLDSPLFREIRLLQGKVSTRFERVQLLEKKKKRSFAICSKMEGTGEGAWCQEK